MAKEKKDTLQNAESSVKEETKKAKKDKKSNKNDEGKKGFFAGIAKWFKDLKIEFKNVTWPTKKTVLINTSIVASIIVGLLDLGLLELLKFLIGLSQGE